MASQISMPKGWSEQQVRQENHSARELKNILDTYFKSENEYKVLSRADRWIVLTSRPLKDKEIAAINKPTSTSRSQPNPTEPTSESTEGDDDHTQQFAKPKRQESFFERIIGKNTPKWLGGQS